jgi:hypothetical protein
MCVCVCVCVCACVRIHECRFMQLCVRVCNHIKMVHLSEIDLPKRVCKEYGCNPSLSSRHGGHAREVFPRDVVKSLEESVKIVCARALL